MQYEISLMNYILVPKSQKVMKKFGISSIFGFIKIFVRLFFSPWSIFYLCSGFLKYILSVQSPVGDKNTSGYIRPLFLHYSSLLHSKNIKKTLKKKLQWLSLYEDPKMQLSFGSICTLIIDLWRFYPLKVTW